MRVVPIGLLAFVLSAAPAGQSELVIAKEGSKEYHRPGCEQVKDGKNVLALTRAQASARGLTPHEACDPSQRPAAPTEPPGAPAPASPTVVFTDGTRYYHKKDCGRLGKDPKKMDLEEAGRKYWPCPTCKPPIRKRKTG